MATEEPSPAEPPLIKGESVENLPTIVPDVVTTKVPTAIIETDDIAVSKDISTPTNDDPAIANTVEHGEEIELEDKEEISLRQYLRTRPRKSRALEDSEDDERNEPRPAKDENAPSPGPSRSSRGLFVGVWTGTTEEEEKDMPAVFGALDRLGVLRFRVWPELRDGTPFTGIIPFGERKHCGNKNVKQGSIIFEPFLRSLSQVEKTDYFKKHVQSPNIVNTPKDVVEPNSTLKDAPALTQDVSTLHDGTSQNFQESKDWTKRAKLNSSHVPVGVWKGSRHVIDQEKHAVYAWITNDDKIRFRLHGETRDGREFSAADPASKLRNILVPIKDVTLDAKLSGLSKAELKEYVSIRGRTQEATPELDEERAIDMSTLRAVKRAAKAAARAAAIEDEILHDPAYSRAASRQSGTESESKDNDNSKNGSHELQHQGSTPKGNLRQNEVNIPASAQLPSSDEQSTESDVETRFTNARKRKVDSRNFEAKGDVNPKRAKRSSMISSMAWTEQSKYEPEAEQALKLERIRATDSATELKKGKDPKTLKIGRAKLQRSPSIDAAYEQLRKARRETQAPITQMLGGTMSDKTSGGANYKQDSPSWKDLDDSPRIFPEPRRRLRSSVTTAHDQTVKYGQESDSETEDLLPGRYDETVARNAEPVNIKSDPGFHDHTKGPEASPDRSCIQAPQNLSSFSTTYPPDLEIKIGSNHFKVKKVRPFLGQLVSTTTSVINILGHEHLKRWLLREVPREELLNDNGKWYTTANAATSQEVLVEDIRDLHEIDGKVMEVYTHIA